jgi:hypothetical protein
MVVDAFTGDYALVRLDVGPLESVCDVSRRLFS